MTAGRVEGLGPFPERRAVGARLRRAVNDVLLGSLVMWGGTLLPALFHPNATVVGLGYVVVVLGVSVWRGLLAGAVASVNGVALLDYFFIGPVGWRVRSTEDTVALATFLIASTLASRLVVVARSRAAESEARGREVRVLYDLSIELFAPTGRAELVSALARAFERLGMGGGALLVAEAGEPSSFSGFGRRPPAESDPRLRDALATGRVLSSAGKDGFDVDVPLLIEGRAAGVFSIRGTPASREAIDSAARLVALALERERLLAGRFHLEALRESDALKTSLLRAVAHDLRTPLTAIRLKIETLRRLLPPASEGEEALVTMTREVENLKHRIHNLLSMSRLQAGVTVPHPEPSPAADLFRTAREGLESILEGKTVIVDVAEDCPDVLVDPSLAVEILVNLLENAAHAAPGGSPLELLAEASGDGVRMAVLDRGPGLRSTIGELSPGGVRKGPEAMGAVRRGLGLEIARGLASASHGTIGFEARPGGGTIASVTFPAFLPPGEAEVRTT